MQNKFLTILLILMKTRQENENAFYQMIVIKHQNKPYIQKNWEKINYNQSFNSFMREAVTIQKPIYDNDLCHERVKVLFIILLRQNSKGLIDMHEKTLFTKKNTILPRGVASFPTNFEDEEVLVFKVLLVRILE